MLVDLTLSMYLRESLQQFFYFNDENRISTARGLHLHLEQNITFTDNNFYHRLGHLVDIITTFLYLKELPCFLSYEIQINLKLYVTMVIQTHQTQKSVNLGGFNWSKRSIVGQPIILLYLRETQHLLYNFICQHQKIYLNMVI